MSDRSRRPAAASGCLPPPRVNQPHSKGANTDAAPSAAWGCRLPPQARPAPAPLPARLFPAKPGFGLPFQRHSPGTGTEKKKATGAGGTLTRPAGSLPCRECGPQPGAPAVISTCCSFSLREFTEHLLWGKQERGKPLTARNRTQKESESAPQTDNNFKCRNNS